ncbi:AGE family epimerase/isomerase [Maricaulis sp.]|uniref:AGE family epimerase/isomerase n=1 Tax=unclassified Maricaulis TaxID=2632371 RepID=UPI001B19E3D0|nr:AGE family epimerase/isomerase [Maricaulis sp.]MBO6796547.1 AGE family epimerase/isomerase [Maricaulis sp.]
MDTVKALADWGVHSFFPLWREKSLDPETGGFFEVFDARGEPRRDADRRVRVQARQIYTFARAHLRGWCDGLEAAQSGWDYLQKHARHPDGGYAHRLNARGEIISDLRDLYDHAFILLAASFLAEVTGDPRYLQDCDDLLEFLDTRMCHPTGGYIEAVGAGNVPRRQNPHMHLFEALMIFRQAGGKGGLARATEIHALFHQRFYSKDHGVLFEFFESDLKRLSAETGPVAEPGHMFEWVWLLNKYALLSGEDISPAAEHLFRNAMRMGINPSSGLLISSMDETGVVSEHGTRTWMQNEWFRAACVAKTRGFEGADVALEMAGRAMLDKHFAVSLPGGWIEHFDGAGNPVGDDMPASTPYHIIGALIEADKLLDSDLC